MKKKWLFFLTVVGLFFMVTSIAPVRAEETDETDQQTYYHYGPDDEARNDKLLDEAEKKWKSKPPHQHTLDDAQNTAKKKREYNPRYLLRDETREEQMKMNQDLKLNDAITP